MSEEKKEYDCELDQQPEEITEPELTEEESETIEDTVYDWAKCLVSAVVGVVLIFTFLVRLISVLSEMAGLLLFSSGQIVASSFWFGMDCPLLRIRYSTRNEPLRELLSSCGPRLSFT